MSVNSAHTKILDRGVVIAQNNQGDLQLVFGSTQKSKSWFFQNADINRFALRKPVIYNQAVGPLTDLQMGEAQCGLSPITLTKMLAMSYIQSASASYTAAQVIAEAAQWTYNRPNGVGSQGQWWRTLDFYPYVETTNAVGYNKEAIAPDSGWAGKTFESSDLDTLAAVTETITGSGNAFVLSPSAVTPKCESFNAKFDLTSGHNKGDTTNMEIPITWVTGLTGNWRMAIAVCIPVNGTDYWHYFIGCRIIQDFLNGVSGVTIGDIIPDYGTNPAAAYLMKQYVASNGATDFAALPVFVKDIGYTYVNIGGGSPLFTPQVTQNSTQIYCMPSGTNSMIIHGGTPTYVFKCVSEYTDVTGGRNWFVHNTDTSASHFCTYELWVDGELKTSGESSFSAGERRQVGHTNNPSVGQLKITSEDGHPAE